MLHKDYDHKDSVAKKKKEEEEEEKKEKRKKEKKKPSLCASKGLVPR
jgi:hypothetical protein